MQNEDIEELFEKLNWVITLRWFAATAIGILFVIFYPFLPYGKNLIIPTVAGVCIEYAMNILLMAAIQKRRFLLQLAHLSIMVDILVIITGTYFGGRLDVNNGLIYVVPICIASIILSMKAGVGMAGVTSALYTIAIYLSFPDNFFQAMVDTTLVEKVFFFFLIGALVGYLSDSFRRYKDSLRKTQEQLIKAEKLSTISQITVSLSHEINNPLTAVLINAQIFLNKFKKLLVHSETEALKQLEKHVAVIENQARRIKDIMDDLREITNPVSEEYIPGTKMINISKSARHRSGDTPS